MNTQQKNGCLLRYQTCHQDPSCSSNGHGSRLRLAVTFYARCSCWDHFNKCLCFPTQLRVPPSLSVCLWRILFGANTAAEVMVNNSCASLCIGQTFLGLTGGCSGHNFTWMTKQIFRPRRFIFFLSTQLVLCRLSDTSVWFDLIFELFDICILDKESCFAFINGLLHTLCANSDSKLEVQLMKS